MSDPSESVAVIDTSNGKIFGVALASCPWCANCTDFSALVGFAECEATDTQGPVTLSAISCLSCGAQGPMSESGAHGAAVQWSTRRPKGRA